MDTANLSKQELFLKFAKIAYMDGKLLEKEKLLLNEEAKRLGLFPSETEAILNQAISEYDAKAG